MKFIPSNYQQYCIEKLIEIPFAALHLEMGLGKTAIVESVLQELKFNRWQIRKVLIIAPKQVAEATWVNELTKWDHLTLRPSIVMGTEAQRIAALGVEADLYIINRDNVCWLVDYYSNRQRFGWPFDVLVIDESTSFKNPRAKRFKALKTIRARVNRVIELTGTPAPHGLTDLWSQIYLLDGGKRLGRTITAYRDMFFTPDKRNGMMVYSYKPKPGAEDVIYQLISDICISMRAEDYLTLPDLITNEIPVKLDAKAKQAYQRLERDALLQVTEDELVTAGTAGVLTGKLLQLCNGAVYDENGNVHQIHDCKLDMFKELLEQLNGEHALVFYRFQHDRDRLMEALAGMKLHARVYEGAQDEADWNAGKIDVLLAHPASCAYGLNLQQGGHHVIWFGLTWNLEEFQQANKRLHRRGQQMPVVVHILSVEGGVDEDVLKSLSGKSRVQDRLIDALKVRLTKAKKEG